MAIKWDVITSPFPDCILCKHMAWDGGWLDNKNYRFWVCIECDDWLDDYLKQFKKTKEEKPKL